MIIFVQGKIKFGKRMAYRSKKGSRFARRKFLLAILAVKKFQKTEKNTAIILFTIANIMQNSL